MTQHEAQSLVRKQILHGSVWNHPDYLEPSEGLAQAFRGPDRAVMVSACAELLTDPEIPVRSGIVAVLSHFTGDLGAEWLAETLERHSDLFEVWSLLARV